MTAMRIWTVDDSKSPVTFEAADLFAAKAKVEERVPITSKVWTSHWEMSGHKHYLRVLNSRGRVITEVVLYQGEDGVAHPLHLADLAPPPDAAFMVRLAQALRQPQTK